MNRLLRSLLLSSCLLLAPSASAQIEESIMLGEDLEVPFTRYEAFADEAPILLWLPSSRGVSSKQAITAADLGDLDIETWIVDLHTAYFIDTGSDSVQHFQAQDISELISAAAARSSRKVYILATGSAARPALEGIALYQQKNRDTPELPRLGGAILFHPALSYPALEAGKAVKYLPIAYNSTIPIYFIQPSISTRQSRSKELQQVLQLGGSPVFFHTMQNISAGFHLRPDHDLSDADIAQRTRLPGNLRRAIEILSSQDAAGIPKDFSANQDPPRPSGARYGLKPLRNHTAQPLKLKNFASQAQSIDYAGNGLTLVSFWTSWCPPCIKELPSLGRLHEDFHDQGLKVITVNVGETIDALQPIMEKHGMERYTNLSDPEGEEMKKWNVYAFPSNFLVSQDGNVSYGSIGGVEWDEEDVRNTITSLLDSYE